jgi:hypothetical protein
MGGAVVHQRGQPAVGGRADHDRAGPDGIGVLGDHPAGCAVIGRVQQDVALGRDVARGQLVQVVPDHGPRRVQALAVDRHVARCRLLLGVHHVHHPAVVRRQHARGLGDEFAGR